MVSALLGLKMIPKNLKNTNAELSNSAKEIPKTPARASARRKSKLQTQILETDENFDFSDNPEDSIQISNEKDAENIPELVDVSSPGKPKLSNSRFVPIHKGKPNIAV